MSLEKQKQIKVISKVLSLLGKIGAIVLRVGIVFLIIAIVCILMSLSYVSFKDGMIVSNKPGVKIVEHGDKIDLRVKNSTIISNVKKKDIMVLEKSFKKYSKNGVIILIELGLIGFGAFIICLIKFLRHLELLFKNINEGDTPFILDNVDHLKKMCYLAIACLVLFSIGEAFLDASLGSEMEMSSSSFNVVEILFLYALSLIFEYGYEIQKDSKKRIYDK